MYMMPPAAPSLADLWQLPTAGRSAQDSPIQPSPSSRLAEATRWMVSPAGDRRDPITGLNRAGGKAEFDPQASFATPLATAQPAELSGGLKPSLPVVDTDYFFATTPLPPVKAAAVAAVVPAPLLVKGVNSNLSFSLSWDTSVASAPSAFTTLVGSTAQALANKLTAVAPVTVNIKVGWGTLNGGALPNGAIGATSNFLTTYGSSTAAYNLLRSKVVGASSASVIDQQMLAGALPTTAPISGFVYLSTAQAKALKVVAGTQASLDAYVGFAATDYLQTTASGYDLSGVINHEFTEVMGRVMLTGAKVGTATLPGYTLEDLMHFSAPGARLLSSRGGYISANGVNRLAYLNTSPTGDIADYASPTASNPNLGADAFNAASLPGATTFATNDLFTMDALGWNLAPGSGLTTLSAPPYLA